MEEEHYIVIEQDGYMTNGGMKVYQQETSYDVPTDNIEDVDKLCLLLEARLI